MKNEDFEVTLVYGLLKDFLKFSGEMCIQVVAWRKDIICHVAKYLQEFDLFWPVEWGQNIIECDIYLFWPIAFRHT